MGPYFCLKCERANSRDAVVTIIGDKYRCTNRESCDERYAELRRMRGGYEQSFVPTRLPVEDMDAVAKKTPAEIFSWDRAVGPDTTTVVVVAPENTIVASSVVAALPILTAPQPPVTPKRVEAPKTKAPKAKRKAARKPDARRPGPNAGAVAIKRAIAERKVQDGKRVRVLTCGHVVPETPGGKAHLASAALCYACGTMPKSEAAALVQVA